MARLKNRITRWVIITTLAFLAIIAASFFVLPKLISTDLVLTRFQQEISASIGQNVTFDPTPEITLLPSATITLENLIVGPTDEREGEVLMVAEQFSANINLLSALTGDPSFSNYILTRPTIHFELYQNGTSNWFPKTIFANGALQPTSAQQDSETVVQAHENVLIDLQDLTIIGGSIDVISNPGAEPERISSINGSLNWPEYSAPLSANLSAIVRGEEMRVEISNFSPSSLFSGERFETDFVLNSALVNLAFQGAVHSTDKLFFDGELILDTPSARRALEWAGNDIKPGAALGAIDLTSNFSGTLGAAKFEDLIIRIEGNRGLGILEFALVDDAPPMISGTLAFNSLDIENFMRAFTPLPRSGEDIAETIDTRFLKQLGLDLRLSAQSANFGPIELSNLAAAVQIHNDVASFNIGGSNAYGGQLISKVSISEKGIDGGGEVSISARQINFASFLEALELEGPLPEGIGDLDIRLSSERPLWATDISNIKGKFEMSMEQGAIPNLNLQSLLESAGLSQFFNLSDVADGEMVFDAAKLSADINAGVARLNNAYINTENEKLVFTGVIPFAKSSLAVFGNIYDRVESDNDEEQVPSEQKFQTTPSLSLFIGGSWPNPVLSPPITDGIFE